MESRVIDEKYRVIRVLGEGGMGAVYEAEHLVTGRRVALKVIVSHLLLKETGALARFQREARASGAIDSQYVVQVLDSGVDAATQNPYLVMEYLAGEDLSQLIRRLTVLPPDLALRITAQACLGLQRAHDAGIIHRDIKSANTYLARRDNGEVVVKLLDFGIAKVRVDPLAEGGDHKLTRTGSLIGSPLYMSPEQARGMKTLDERADIWSLGVALYESLTGTTPNQHCDTIGSLIFALFSEDAEPIQNRAPWVQPAVAAVVHKALAREPEGRFASASEMHAAIVAIIGPSIGIREEMLVPLDDTVRAIVAPRLVGHTTGSRVVRTTNDTDTDALARTAVDPTTTGSGSKNVGSDTAEDPRPETITKAGTKPGGAAGVGMAAPSDTIVGAAVTAGATKGSRGWLLPAVGLVAVVGLGGAVYAARSSANVPPKDSATPPPQSAPSSAPVDSAVADKLPQKTPPDPTATPVVRAEVTIAPASARVLVDGEPTTPHDGRVTLSGTAGSLHKVEISLEGKSAKADVVLSERGPIPPKVELPGASAPRPSGAGKGEASPAPQKPAAAKPTPAAPPSEPAINRNF